VQQAASEAAVAAHCCPKQQSPGMARRDLTWD
jgi:hypothetical protein